jgi:hypothetical protein
MSIVQALGSAVHQFAAEAYSQELSIRYVSRPRKPAAPKAESVSHQGPLPLAKTETS